MLFISVQEIFMYALSVLVIGLISYPLSLLLTKLNGKLMFALPIFFAVVGGGLLIAGMLQQGWAIFSYTIYGVFSLLIALGCLLGSLFLLYRTKHNQNK